MTATSPSPLAAPDPPPLGPVLETVLYYPPEKHEAMAAFYGSILGLRSIGDAQGRFLFYRAGSGVFLLFNHDAAAAQDSPPPHGATGPGHACFLAHAGAYEAWKEHLNVQGVALEEEVEWPRGGRSFYFRDPAGNALEIADRDVWPG